MAEPSQAPQRSAGQHMLHGSFWLISLRWPLRLVGLVRPLILARLLPPAGFGVALGPSAKIW